MKWVTIIAFIIAFPVLGFLLFGALLMAVAGKP
jgi:hypothetical protein